MSREYVQFWDWFNEFGRRARIANDQERIRLYELDDKGFAERQKNPDYALALYREGAVLAERLNESCMTLFYEHGVARMLIHHLSRYEEGLEMAAHLVAKSSRAPYTNCPVRSRIYMTLIAAYLNTDALSYIDEVRAMLNTLEHEMPIDDDVHARIHSFRGNLWMDLKEYDKAWDETLKHLELSEQSPFRKTHAYRRLCYLSYLRHQDRQALDYAFLLEDMAQKADYYSEVAVSYFWQALFHTLNGDGKEAERLFMRGVAQATSLNLWKPENYTHIRCRYYEARGEYEKSLAVWDEQIQMMNPETSRREGNFYKFLRRCFVLRKLGRLKEIDVEHTRQAALRLHRPALYLALMEELHDGNTEIPRY